VRCACLSRDVVILAVNDSQGLHCELFMMDSASGRQIFPPFKLKGVVTEMRFATSSDAILVLEDLGQIVIWEITGSNDPKLLAEAVVPSNEGDMLEVGFMPDSVMLFVRFSDGKVIAYHLGLKAWLALDVWRYSCSPLQCHAPLPPPRAGPLSKLLWDWRRPRLPLGWGEGFNIDCAGNTLIPATLTPRDAP